MKDQLAYLERVQGVKGAFVADVEGRLIESSWDSEEDRAVAERVVLMVSLALQGIQAEGGEAREIYLTYEKGRVVVNKLSAGNLVLLCASEVNMMLLKEAVKHCCAEIDKYVKETKPIELLRDVCIELLGDKAGKPLEMLASAKPTLKELRRTCKEIENFTKLLINREKAEQLTRELSKVLDEIEKKGETK